MTEQTIFSLSQAAKITGKGKATISNALKNGRLSYVSNEGGQYQIDGAELFRVFPRTAPNGVRNTAEDRSRTPSERQTELPPNAELAILRNRLAMVEELRTHDRESHEKERRQLAERIDELREDRDAWKGQAERSTLLLTDQRQPTAAAAPAEPVRQGFRFLGFEIRRKSGDTS